MLPRRLVKDATNASDQDDVVLFCGAGATAGVNKLVSMLGLVRGGSDSATFAGNLKAKRACPFSGCGRAFDDPVDLKLHCRSYHDPHESGDGHRATVHKSVKSQSLPVAAVRTRTVTVTRVCPVPGRRACSCTRRRKCEYFRKPRESSAVTVTDPPWQGFGLMLCFVTGRDRLIRQRSLLVRRRPMPALRRPSSSLGRTPITQASCPGQSILSRSGACA